MLLDTLDIFDREKSFQIILCHTTIDGHLLYLEKPGNTKMDEFSEKFQTALDLLFLNKNIAYFWEHTHPFWYCHASLTPSWD